jgi:hypothetical protein
MVYNTQNYSNSYIYKNGVGNAQPAKTWNNMNKAVLISTEHFSAKVNTIIKLFFI